MQEDIKTPYKPQDTSTIRLGNILLNNEIQKDGSVNLVVRSFNRHGLIAGATGSGKTKSIQVLAEQLSSLGIPSLVMDIKGDISGLAMPGEASEKLLARSQELGLTYTPQGFPVEFLTLNPSHQGIPLRATVEDFGALLFGRMLDVNDTQAGVITVLFEYAKSKGLHLVDLNDFKDLLQYVQTDAGKADIEGQFGGVASSSVGTIVRKVIELEAQGGDEFFGKPAYEVQDLIRVNASGRGVISILRLLDMQDKPKLFSTFMLKLLTDVYRQLPELGDPEKPKLVIFIDEAHLIFNNAGKALLDLLDTMVKLIRSKGVGLFFCTQSPDDIPESVLSQLGLKIQHALRAFTAKDRKAIKLVAQNFPPSEFYNTEQLLTDLGIGEALLTALDGKGQPTPLICCMMRAPESRMGVLSEQELQQCMQQSTLNNKYHSRIKTTPIKDFLPKAQQQETVAKSDVKEPQNTSVLNDLSKNTLFRQLVRQFFRDLMRTALSFLKGKK